MNNNAILTFYKSVVDDELNDHNEFFQLIDSVFSEGKDIEVFRDQRIKLSFLGALTKELKEVNENIVLAYKFYENHISCHYEHYGFIFHETSKDVVLDYYVVISECFKDENPDNPFEVNFLITPDSNNFQYYDFDYYENVKSIIGEETYKSFVDYMLEKTNNKLKNSIYKIF